MAIKRGTKLYDIDQRIKKQNARLDTWLKHSDFESNITGGLTEVSEFQTLQNQLQMLTSRHPELKQYARYDKYGRIIGFSRNKKALEAFNEITPQDLRVIERQPTYGEVYERNKKALEKDLKRAGLSLTSKRNGMSIKQQVELYIREQSEIQFALNAMGTIYALNAEGNDNAKEVLQILRGEDKGGNRALTESGTYESITPEEWDIVREKLGIISTDPRFKKEISKKRRLGK